VDIEASDPTVAVIIRTRDRPVLLRRALEDVLAQTFGDFVAVVVNDAGDPGAVEAVVSKFAEAFGDRITIVHNEVSHGREAAVNVGFDAVGSTHVVVHDDDDTWAPTFLAETVQYLDRSSDGAVGVRTEVVYERIDGERIEEIGRELFASNRTSITLAQTLVHSYVVPNSLLVRRSVIDAVGPWDPALPVLADWDFLLRVLAAFDVGFIDGEPLAFWHHRPESIGPDGNSVIVDADEHRQLADDVRASGGLGTLLYLTGLAERHRAEAADQLHVAVSHFDTRRQDLVTELHDLNQNLISQTNRLVAQLEQLRTRVEVVEDVIRNNAPRARLARYRASLAGRLGRAAGRSPLL
jgi:glycosyltransferase involved in cell wall biosynthesis